MAVTHCASYSKFILSACSVKIDVGPLHTFLCQLALKICQYRVLDRHYRRKGRVYFLALMVVFHRILQHMRSLQGPTLAQRAQLSLALSLCSVLAASSDPCSAVHGCKWLRGPAASFTALTANPNQVSYQKPPAPAAFAAPPVPYS